ncbi:MAG TPA: right-handed parallel beta-helix repeat-containing protein [Anaerolineales bacterium]|nr:right-handed parallel beta-helix repeat-containing protein [Anaerolineales bacterium]
MSALKKTHLRIFATAALLVWTASAIWTMPALADSGSTPPAAGLSSDGRTSSRGSASNPLSQAPAGTKVVILNSNGDKIPLGSQAARDIISSGDPIWCPNTVTTPNNSGLHGCTAAAPNLFDLIANISSNVNKPNADGTIWILGYSDNTDPGPNHPDSSNSAIIINGLNAASFGSWANFSLTLKGGWKGCVPTCSNAIDTNSPSQFQVPINIDNWNGNVILSDIAISSPSGTGLTVTTTKNITLTRVQSNGNSGDGADLDNSGGTGAVTASSGTFDSNSGSGLVIYSNGSITLNTITASDNSGGYGAYVDNSSAPHAQAVNITGTNNIFNDNYLNGLLAFSLGHISAGNLHADGNSAGVDGSNYAYSGGVQLENDFAGTGTITISGTNTFTNNYEDGLDAYSDGAITTNNLTATRNGLQGNPTSSFEWIGAALDNSNSLTPQNITMGGNNDFESNFNDGVDAIASGVLTINNITSKNNGTSVGTSSQLQGGVGAYLQGARAVTLSGTNLFDGNYSTITFDDGNPADYLQTPMASLTISSDGSIRINNVTASDDLAGAGAILDDCNDQGTGCANTAGSIAITGANIFNDNYLDGLDVDSFGNIAAKNLSANGNLGMGVFLMNGNASATTSLNSKGYVALSSTNTFTDNLDDGMDIYSNGPIKAGNLQAVNNGGAGVILDNSSSPNAVPLDNSGVVAALSSVSTQTAQSVTLTNYNVFSDNGFDGLEVYSNGTITLSSISANGNGAGYGAYIANDETGFRSGVTLSGNDSFNDNYLDGLDILSYGAISVTTVSLTADGNGLSGNNGVGVYLDNCVDQGAGCTVGSARSVVLSGSNVIDGNYGQYYDGVNTYDEAGLVTYSKGRITASNVTANDTVNGAGAVLDNSQGSSSSNVALAGASEFDQNAGDGLDVHSHGALAVTKVIADGNLGVVASGYAGTGVNVSAVSKVTLTCGDVLNNLGYGINVSASPLLTLTGVLLDDNSAGNVNYGGVPVESLACTLP